VLSDTNQTSALFIRPAANKIIYKLFARAAARQKSIYTADEPLNHSRAFVNTKATGLVRRIFSLVRKNHPHRQKESRELRAFKTFGIENKINGLKVKVFSKIIFVVSWKISLLVPGSQESSFFSIKLANSFFKVFHV